MSGFTPTCSQLVLVTKLIMRELGIATAMSFPTLYQPTGFEPPPVASPITVPRFCTCMPYAKSSPAENVRAEVNTYTGLS
ncbi:hypothetical protein D0T23_25420 [Duganella sp. BJB475]|nr:hypothetical protein D0T23_25420 [Duganella sp. BJB475]RFP27714.1 hypothetical protein D0T21_23465 [Duganella sp. BJB476]